MINGPSTGTGGELPCGTPIDCVIADFAAQIRAPGHAVDNAREAVGILEMAFAAGTVARTPTIDAMLTDLSRAIEPREDDRLGGKSAEASRLILRAIERELTRQAA